jgi:hypothetical protein
MNARECAQANHHAISRVGGGFMVDPSVTAAADRLGLTFMQFYVLGRAGVLGSVAPEAASAQLAIMNPSFVQSNWSAGVAVVDPQVAAAAYANCCQGWGRARLAGPAASPPALALLGRVVDGLDLQSLPLVAGWRALPLPPDPPARLAQLLNVLREYRGALHARAVADVGLSPVEAIVAGPDGPERAGLLGWPPPYPDAGVFADRRAQAEVRTDDLASDQFSRLTESERVELTACCDALLAAARRR